MKNSETPHIRYLVLKLCESFRVDAAAAASLCPPISNKD